MNNLVGRMVLCPCCQYRDPAGEPSASVRLTKPNRRGSRVPYMQCGTCGVKFWGNRPEHLAAVVAWSSILTDSPEVAEALRERVSSLFRGLAAGTQDTAPTVSEKHEEANRA